MPFQKDDTTDTRQHPVKPQNRDSINAKVFGKGEEGVWGRGGKTFLQKGFPSPPPVRITQPDPTRYETDRTENLALGLLHGRVRGGGGDGGVAAADAAGNVPARNPDAVP